MQTAYLDKFKEDKEGLRLTSFLLAKVAGSKARTVKEFMPFPWDPKPKQLAPLTEEEKAAQAKFSEEADEFLKTSNPAAYAAYMAGKNKQHG